MFSSSVTTTARAHSPSQACHEPAWKEALGKAKDAIGRGNAEEAVHGLSAHFGGDAHAFHDALLNLLDSASSEMRQQLVGQARNERPDFALDTHNKEGKTALDLAVRHKDTEFADYLLRHGANPERISLVSATPDMHALVTKWRRKNLLYAELDKKEWTPIDHALNNGHDEKIDQLLTAQGATSLENHAGLWDLATENGRHDVLRAMVLLRPDALRELAKDKQRVGKWLNELRQDPGLSAVLKEFPYQSAKRGEPAQFNGKVAFRNTEELIKCRHLATYQQEAQALVPKIKFDYRKFGSEDAIAANVLPEIEETYETLMAQASATHLIDNRKFGQFLAKQFQEMEMEDKPATRLMQVQSTRHMMNLGLMIKEEDGRKSYVVKFFDPNYTTTGTRSKASNVQTLETQTLADYMAEEWRLHRYYPETNGVSMIFVRPKEGDQISASTAVSEADRRLTTCIDIKDVNTAAIWHFMYRGFTANLRDLRSHLDTLSEDQRIEQLIGKGANGSPALFMAMQEGKAEAIRAYCELVQQAGPIQELQLIELLAAKNANGTPALWKATQKGHTEAIKAYGELVESLCGESRPSKGQKTHAEDGPSATIMDQLVELFAGKKKDGVPALWIALEQGHTAAVMAYGAAIQFLPPDKQADLLLAKVHTGPRAMMNGGFMAAMKGRHFEAATAQLQLLVQLTSKLTDEDKRTTLWNDLQIYDRFISGAQQHVPPRYLGECHKMASTFAELKDKLSKVPSDT